MIFNGVDLEQYFEDDFIVKDVRGRTITQNELETLSIPLANGEILIDSKIPPKVLEVDIALNANTKRDLNKKIDELNSIIHTRETVPIVFKDEPDMTYYGILGTSKEDPEEANVHEATLNIVVLDGLKYGPKKEIKINPMEENKIYYAGTAPVIPEIEIIPKEKTTYAGYTNGEKSVLVGYPMDVESILYKKTETVFNQILRDTTGWNPATTMYGIDVTGEFRADVNYGLVVQDFGSGPRWHGPSLVRTLSEPLYDFELSVWVGFDNDDMSKIVQNEWHLLSADNEVLARIAIGDWFVGNTDMVISYDIGSVNHHKEFRFKKTEWAGFGGIVQLRKEGNVYNLYAARTYPGPKHTQIETLRWIDTYNLIRKPIAKIQLASCQFGTHNTGKPRYNQIHLRKINPDKEDMIPYIAEPGDVITIGDSGVIYKNGKQTGGLDVSSVFFPLEKGENKLTVLPPNSDVIVRFREAFK